VPPQRRRPVPSTGQAPIRRPRVAGLRNRPGHPDEPAEQATPPVEETDGTDSVSGVLEGVLGTPPRATPAPKDTDTDTDSEADTASEDDLRALRAAAEPPVHDDDRLGEDVLGEDARYDEDDLDDGPDNEDEDVPAGPRPAVVARAGTRPAGKRRSTGQARPDDLAGAESGAGAESRPRHSRLDDQSPRARGQRQISVAIVLAVVAVVLAGLAVFFRGQADDLTSGDTDNTALTDPAATSQVKGQLSNAIKQTFSYNYTDLDATEKAVKENLTGKALCEYDLLFGEVKKYAPKQKIVLDTTVRELAVVRIDGDRAEALVYIDQLSTRVDVNKTVAVGGQFAVQAAKDGDHWKITEFDMFGQPLFNGKPAPQC
jgi:Mce-associated membrane protein